jgi:hypothetical protein
MPGHVTNARQTQGQFRLDVADKTDHLARVVAICPRARRVLAALARPTWTRTPLALSRNLAIGSLVL